MNVNVTALRLDHVAFPISDVAGTLHFYRDVLGMPLLRAFSGDDWGGRAWLMMIFALGDGRQLALSTLRNAVPGTDDLPADVRHVAFAVASDDELGAWRERLKAADVAFCEEDHGEQRSIYFTDPNNVILEITTPPSAGEVTPEDGHDATAHVANWLARAT